MPVNKNFFLQERQARIKWILSLISDNQTVPWKKIKGIIILKSGLKGNTVEEYIRDLKDGGVIEWNEDQQNYKSIL